MMKRLIAAAMVFSFAMPAAAEVTIAETGFAVSNEAVVAASREDVWAALVEPSRYWNGEHSWSGDAANFSLDPVAGGCFCENWDGGSVEHLRVAMARPGEQLILRGALGPLITQGLAGSMNWELIEEGENTRIRQNYIVGGHMTAFDIPSIAPAVDAVLREQLERLAALFPAAQD